MSIDIFTQQGDLLSKPNINLPRHNRPSRPRLNPPSSERPALSSSNTKTAPKPRQTSVGVDLHGCRAMSSNSESRKIRLGKTARFDRPTPTWNASSGRELRRWLMDNYNSERYDMRSETTATLLALSAERAHTPASTKTTTRSAEPTAGPDASSTSTFQILRRTVNDFESWVQKKILTDAQPTKTTPSIPAADIRWDVTIPRGVNGSIGVTLAWSRSEDAHIVTTMTHAAVLRCTTQMRKGDVVISLNGTMLRKNDDPNKLLDSCGQVAQFVMRAPVIPVEKRTPMPSPTRPIPKATLDIVRLSQERDDKQRQAVRSDKPATTKANWPSWARTEIKGSSILAKEMRV